MEILYHKEIGFPKDVAVPTNGTVFLAYSFHAKLESLRDRYGKIVTPDKLDLSKCDIIELGVDHQTRKLTKVLARTYLDKVRDLCIVYMPNNANIVKTVWVNVRSDLHKTLDKSRYSRIGI